jgi:integrase
MANGKWRAEVVKHGKRSSKVLATKTAAKDWAAGEEYAIANSDRIAAEGELLSLIERYSRERSSQKKGARWEQIRLNALTREAIAKIRIADIKASDIATWRDGRLREVSPATVLRDMNLLSSVFSVAVKEWGLMSANPMTDVKRPKAPPARDRLATPTEMEMLARSAGDDLSKATARTYHAFLFSIETAMRAGEICALRWSDLDLESRVAHLRETKNGTPRQVPLSSEAIRLIQALPHADPVFGLETGQREALWRKLRDRSGVKGLTFHDGRHIAITRLSKRVDVLALARMVGHRNISQLLTYYNETAADLAKRLD